MNLFDPLTAQHPERMSFEAFLGTFSDEGFADVSYLTKRQGIQAYTIDGVPYSGYKPVFIDRAEYIEVQARFA